MLPNIEMGGYRLNNTSQDGFTNFAAHSAYVENYFSDDHDTGTDSNEGSGAPGLHLHGSDAPQLRLKPSPEHREDPFSFTVPTTL